MFVLYILGCILVLYFLCCICVLHVTRRIISKGNTALPCIGPIKAIKFIAIVSGWKYGNKFCLLHTGLEPDNSTLETINWQFWQCTNHECSYGKNAKYSPLRTSGRLCGILVSYFLCCVICVVFFHDLLKVLQSIKQFLLLYVICLADFWS